MPDPVQPTDGERLIRWYDQRRRDLPWRRDRDPYRVWISEIMLQQTRVDVVTPYYLAFLERFPDVEALAAAPVEDVLAAWSGLGYYRRARYLHAAAREIADGGWPRSADTLRALPGIGEYTAAAIASIVYDEVVPVLDGNVERVTARRLALADDPKRAAPRRRLRTEAASLLVAERPGDSNQALMELGATVCRPRAPLCLGCPLADGCRGKTAPALYPAPRRRRAAERHDLLVAVVRRADGRILLFRRSDAAELMPGLWELPAITPDGSRPAEELLAARYGGRWRLSEDSGRTRHGITHRDLHLDVRSAALELPSDEIAEGPEAAWIDPDDPAQRSAFATSSMVDKALGVTPRARDGGD
ncbi:MAG: A/G-specific adenine glycosylase [Acidobacteriota bacterium]